MDTPGTPLCRKRALQPSTSGLTISKFSKFGKALEHVPCLGCECYTPVPGAMENMVALDHVLQVGDFLSEGHIQLVVIH